MKQISESTAKKIATSNKSRLEDEIKYCQADWIKENARYIADIECGRVDKTIYGEWPKGWKREMRRAAIEMATRALVERFLRDECKQLDGAIWLGNMQMIEDLEKPKR